MFLIVGLASDQLYLNELPNWSFQAVVSALRFALRGAVSFDFILYVPVLPFFEGKSKSMTAPIEQGGFIKTYSTSRPQVEWEKLAYFAASVFWRASIHDWPLGKQTIERVAISPKYREDLRRFLLGKADFPRQAVVFAWVSALPLFGRHAF